MKSTRQNSAANWPDLPLPDQWENTLTAVHMWSQVIGKIRLELSPWINHSWGSTLYVTSKGLSTLAIPYGDHNFEIRFNFIDHKLEISVSNGTERSFDLDNMSIADFYANTIDLLNEMGIEVDIYAKPVEVETSIPFASDTKKRSYEADTVHKFWQTLVQVQRDFTIFRARFIDKVSPVHFFGARLIWP